MVATCHHDGELTVPQRPHFTLKLGTFAGITVVIFHPFEGPEVFDDEPLEEAECAVKAEVFRELSPWPTVDEVIKSLRGPDH